MEWYFVLLVIVAAVVILIGGIYWLIPKLIRKGIDVSGVLGNTGKMLNVADTLVDTMKGFMADTAALNIVDNIIGWAQKGVDAAEQMYKAQLLQGEDRKEAAIEIVYACLETAGIELTDANKTIVNGAIEAAVKALEKTHVDMATE